MVDIPGGDADLAAIHAEFAASVNYTGSGLVDEPLDAVKIEIAADTFQGPGDSLREIVFEILFSAFAGTPSKGDELVDEDSAAWRVIEVTRRGDISAWHLGVEAAT